MVCERVYCFVRGSIWFCERVLHETERVREGADCIPPAESAAQIGCRWKVCRCVGVSVPISLGGEILRKKYEY